MIKNVYEIANFYINFHPFPKTSHDSRRAIVNFPQDLTGQITTGKSLTAAILLLYVYTSGLFIKLCIGYGYGGNIMLLL